MEYKLFLPNRPFEAIKKGTKKVEGRTITRQIHIDFEKVIQSDTISFQNETTGEIISTKVVFNHHYKTIHEMLETEGPENVLSSEPKTVEHGIESYNALTEYKENINKHGIFALGIKLL